MHNTEPSEPAVADKEYAEGGMVVVATVVVPIVVVPTVVVPTVVVATVVVPPCVAAPFISTLVFTVPTCETRPLCVP